MAKIHACEKLKLFADILDSGINSHYQKSKLLFLTVFAGMIPVFSNCTGAIDQKHAAPDSTYLLTGKIKGIHSGWIYIKHRQSSVSRVDSARVENEMFSIKGLAGAPEFCNMGFQTEGKKDYFFGFFLESGQMTMTADRDSLDDSSVKFTGSPTQNEFKEFQQSARPIDSASYQLQITLDKIDPMNSVKKDSINAALQKLENKRKELIRHFAETHPHSYVAAFEVYSYYSGEKDLVQAKQIYDSLDEQIQQSYFGKLIKTRLEIPTGSYFIHGIARCVT
jgi:hypothetical protein